MVPDIVMRHKFRDISKAEIPGTDYYVRIEKWGRHGPGHEHIERYNDWDAVVLRIDGKPGGWEIRELNACNQRDAQEDFEALAKEVFGYQGELTWKDCNE